MIACFAGPSFHEANGIACDPWAWANEGTSVWPKVGSKAKPEIMTRRLMSAEYPFDFMFHLEGTKTLLRRSALDYWTLGPSQNARLISKNDLNQKTAAGLSKS